MADLKGTPRPWGVSDRGVIWSGDPLNGGTKIAQTLFIGSDRYQEECDNGQLIVQAVNERVALREALEDALESQEQLMGHIAHWRQSDQDALRARIDANKAALAKSRTQEVP